MAEIAYEVTSLVPKIRKGLLDVDQGYRTSFRGVGDGDVALMDVPKMFAPAAPLFINPFPTLTAVLGGGIGAAIGMKAKSPGWAVALAVIFGFMLSEVSPNLMKGFAAGLGGAGLVRLRRGG
jgi:hypothetical protein